MFWRMQSSWEGVLAPGRMQIFRNKNKTLTFTSSNVSFQEGNVRRMPCGKSTSRVGGVGWGWAPVHTHPDVGAIVEQDWPGGAGVAR